MPRKNEKEKDDKKRSDKGEKEERKHKHRKSEGDVLATYSEKELIDIANAGVMEIAEATFDFVARNASEISISKGLYVEIMKKTDTVGWWKGRVRGTTQAGLFPSNYVNVLFSMPEKEVVRTAGGSIKMKPGAQQAFVEAAKQEREKLKESKDKESKGRSKHDSKDKLDKKEKKEKDSKEKDGKSSLRESRNRDKEESKLKSSGSSRKKKDRDEGSGESAQGALAAAIAACGKRDRILVAKVMFDFEARKDTEASVKRGDEVLVVEKGKPNGWWKAQTTSGTIGLIPINYCKVEEREARLWKPEAHYERKMRKVEKLKGKLSSLKKDNKRSRDRDSSDSSSEEADSALEYSDNDDDKHKHLRRRLATALSDNRAKAKRITLLEEKVKVAEELIEYYDAMVKSGGKKKEKNKFWKRQSSKF